MLSFKPDFSVFHVHQEGLQFLFTFWHRVSVELWTEVHNIVQEAVIKIIPKKKKCKEAKCLFEEALQIAEKRREVKGKGEKEEPCYSLELCIQMGISFLFFYC